MEKISFVIPCYKSAMTLPSVIDEIKSAMGKLSEYTYEVILVNDASPDNTYEIIEKLAEENENVHGFELAKNFGQHGALMAGFHQVTGDIIICLDDDGQTDPGEAHKLLETMKNGDFDVVYARYGKKKHSAFRNFGSRVNDLMTRVMLGKPKDLYISSYFAAKRYVIEDMKKYENCYPYVIGLVLRCTKHITNVDINHREREIGSSGYTLWKLLGLWFNGFTAFSIKPLRIATFIGSLTAILGFAYGIYTVIKKFVVPDVPIGYSALMSAVVFIGGMIMLMLGLIGEYVGRSYISANNAPQFVIRRKTDGKQ